MERATISQIKNQLSAYLRKVRAGETVLILDRDEPVARLEAISPADQPEQRATRLERNGLLRSPSQPMPLKTLRLSAPKSKRSVLEVLLEERREGR